MYYLVLELIYYARPYIDLIVKVKLERLMDEEEEEEEEEEDEDEDEEEDIKVKKEKRSGLVKEGEMSEPIFRQRG